MVRAKLPHFFSPNHPPVSIISRSNISRRIGYVGASLRWGSSQKAFLPFHPISERKFFFCTKTLAPLECHSSSTAWEATASAVQWIDQ